MDKELISVIVPIYNVENYIPRIMDRLLKQTYPEIEIILIDDGSRDKSYNVCKEYEKKYCNVYAFTKHNGGAASARNFGVYQSKGAFISFVDADDEISEDYIQFLFDLLIKYNADLSICGFKKFFGQTEIKTDNSTEGIVVLSPEKALEDLLYRRHITNSPWAKLLRKEIFLKAPFPEGLLYEDLAVVYQWIGASKKIVYSPNIKYYYLQREGSSMHSEFSIRKWDRIKITLEMMEYIKTKYPSLTLAADSRMMITSLQMIQELPFESEYDNYKMKLKHYIRETRRKVILDNKNSIKTRVLALSTFLPYRILKYMGMLSKYFIMKFKIVQRY